MHLRRMPWICNPRLVTQAGLNNNIEDNRLSIVRIHGLRNYMQKPRRGTRMTRRDKKVVLQIAEYATPSIWGNPTVTCVGSNAGVWSLQDNMEMLEVLSSQSVRIKIP